jgi:hypothetical protein
MVDGRVRGLFLVVIDSDSRAAADQLLADIDMPKTLDVLTGNGLHIYHWTERPMKSSSGHLGIPNVDVKGAGGYVMAPGSLHYSGAIYTVRGRLEDITMASDDLVDRLVLAEEIRTRKAQRQRITLGQGNIIGIGTARPPSIDIPADLEDLLNQNPPVGQRSEPAFLALRRLAELIDGDLDLAETMMSFPLGVRNYERRHGTCSVRSPGPGNIPAHQNDRLLIFLPGSGALWTSSGMPATGRYPRRPARNCVAFRRSPWSVVVECSRLP